MQLYRKFLTGGIPEYLARHYWWAYLWPRSIWFFDHQPIINAILFGQYNTLLEKTLSQVERRAEANILQLTCVYGKLTPSVMQHSASQLHLCDVAPGQLDLARRKTLSYGSRCLLTRMNAESLAYADNAFDQIILFFLFHEMPPQARQHVYDEIARVVKPGGSVLITEYGNLPVQHWLYRILPVRWVLGFLEPFLPTFWQENVAGKLEQALHQQAKTLVGAPAVDPCFARFYRVMHFKIAH